MSKKIFLLIILLLIQLLFLPNSVFATASCKDSKIDWEPRLFLDGQDGYILNFTIQDKNLLETLKRSGQYLRLLIGRGIFNSGGTYTYSVKVEDLKFSIILTGDLTKNGVHNGMLQWSPTENGNYGDFCTDVIYQVGAATQCVIDPSIPDRIPPNTSLEVHFIGKPDTDYNLMVTTGALASPSKIGNTKTDNTGQGVFPRVVIPGNNGDAITLGVFSSIDNKVCSKRIVIDAKASPPSPRPSGPVQPVPAPQVQKKCKSKDDKTPLNKQTEMICASSEGSSCNDSRGPAIVTAIGCIHTNPAEFAKDLMTWVIGIGGGVAFLMMLLGAFQMLTSAGNPDTLRAGRERLTSAVIGLLVVIFAVLLLQIIGVGILSIPGF